MINQFMFTKPKRSPTKAPACRSSAEAMARRFTQLRGPRPQVSEPMEVEEAGLECTTQVAHSSLAENMARTFSKCMRDITKRKRPVETMEEDLGSESDEGEAEMAVEYLRDRHDIARGKKPAEPVEEDLSSEGSESDEEEAEVFKVAKKPSRKARKEPSPEELYNIFDSMVFSGTKYPHCLTVNEQYLYMFIHQAVGAARLFLPCIEVTKVRTGSNIDFWPPTELLYD